MPGPEGHAVRPAAATTAGVGRVRDALRDWMFNLALPFWSTVGLDRADPDGGFRGACEHLSLRGRPVDPGFKRMRVQARQLYVFSEAAARDAPGAAAIAAGLHRFISRRGAATDGGWARLLDRDGGVLDATNDLYDLASVLFALAGFHRLTGEALALQQAERTLGFLRGRMARRSGGFANAEPAGSGWRQQNPHMHLLEAALALLETSGDERWAVLAAELVALFGSTFLEAVSGTLGEYFDENWRRAPGADGDKAEPGHHAEWVWLLDRHQALTGQATDGLVDQLDRVCLRHGICSETGLVRDEIGRDGSLRLASHRLWPQAEMLKAHCVLHRRAVLCGDAGTAATRLAGVVRTADNLLTRYLVGAEGGALPPGTWIDQLDAAGRPAINKIPTSSLYHVMSAWVELDALQPGLDAARG